MQRATGAEGAAGEAGAAATAAAAAPTNGGAGLAGGREEAGARAPLVVATLRALGALGDDAFRRHLRGTFPLLTRLIASTKAPPEVQRALSDLFARRIGPLLSL
jgi:brefeldin A-inhibited guanine nucleotide-exchange protein